MASVLQEIAALGWTRPGLDATAVQVAAWHDRKAALLERIAAANGPGAAPAAVWADQAHHHASRLRGEAGAGGNTQIDLGGLIDGP